MMVKYKNCNVLYFCLKINQYLYYTTCKTSIIEIVALNWIFFFNLRVINKHILYNYTMFKLQIVINKLIETLHNFIIV